MTLPSKRRSFAALAPGAFFVAAGIPGAQAFDQAAVDAFLNGNACEDCDLSGADLSGADKRRRQL